MTLKRLEMHGFKSFAKRAVFDFSAPVTAIVGPNGSGKSNVVEAIRFVLGEQSSKSLRSKSGADLIFKGSKQTSKMSRASVTITFDNSGRIFSLPSMDDQSISLDFDEISISREVFTDGLNKYSLNGNDVRLKDIHELIASVNIGSSGHHIISQGEADRLLNAKPGERREMLEESLGLKLYHYRIREGERKLEKTRAHVREAEILRRELAPHIKFLKKQVEKIEKARELEIALAGLYETYLVQEQTVLTRKENEITLQRKVLNETLEKLSGEIAEHQSDNFTSTTQPLEEKIQTLRTQIRDAGKSRDEYARQLGRVEGMIEASTVVHKQEKPGVVTVAITDIEELISSLESSDLSSLTAQEVIQQLKNYVASKQVAHSPEIVSVDTTEFEKTKQVLELQITESDQQVLEYEQEIKKNEQELENLRNSFRDKERMFYELQAQKNELISKQVLLNSEHARIDERAHALVEEYIQAEHLVGAKIIDLKKQYLDNTVSIDESALRTMHHELERMKIRLEDMGGGGGGDVIAEHEETMTRDQFLEREINDLVTAIETLESTIFELKEKLSKEFTSGIVKINKEFENFFRLMFGGGDAQLQIVAIEKRKKKELDEEGNELLEEEDDGVKEQGIDIDVSLPRKKVKDLDMLSGGERSLTSIALLFALSQVNPPPFLVLDETDAALDEANSQKYGDMIENLAKETQLVVVTHNRETMSRANILYGVTLGADDASTLLSIKFDEAVKVAK